MRILYFGTYRAEYSRNRIIIEGLRLNGVEVIECHARLWHSMQDREQVVRGGWVKPGFWLRAVRAYSQLLLRYARAGQHDLLFVGYPGQYDIFVARLLAWISRKPLVWDVLNSMHLMASERGITLRHPFTARLIRTLEGAAARLPDRLFLDTEAFVRWFSQLYGLDPGKFRTIPIGADTIVFQDAAAYQSAGGAPDTGDIFRVLYYGTYIPNHGVEVIIEAARLLVEEPQIQFEMVGAGPDRARALALAQEYQLPNVNFIEWLDKHEMAARVAGCDVCLGGFGDTLQASLTNNNKIYEAFALRKPVITGQTPSMPASLRHGDQLYLVPRGNPQALAEAILTLRADPALARRLGENGCKALAHTYDVAAIGAIAAGHLRELLDERSQG
jgi:glycosyltransferase involved in cell wall biosynthesis